MPRLLIAAIALLLTLSAPICHAEQSDPAAQDQIRALQQQLKDAQTANDANNQTIRKLEWETTRLDGRINDLQSRASSTDTHISDLNTMNTSQTNNLIGWSGGLIAFLTLIIAIAAGVTYFNSQKAMRETVKEWMNENGQAWLEKNGNEIFTKMVSSVKEDFYEKLTKTNKEIESIKNESNDILSKLKIEYEKTIEMKENSTQNVLLRTKEEHTVWDIVRDSMSMSLTGESDLAIKRLANYIKSIENKQDETSILNFVKLMFVKAVINGRNKNKIEELRIYDYIIENFQKTDNIKIQIPVASSMFNKAITEEDVVGKDAARQTYQALIDRFSSSTHPAIVQRVADARERLAKLS